MDQQALEGDFYYHHQRHRPAAWQGAGSPVPAQRAAPRQPGLRHDVRPSRPGLSGLGHAQHGASARDGLGMLVEQAAEAFALWRGVCPPAAQVLQELRATEPCHRPATP